MSCKQETYKRLGDYIQEVDVRNSAMEVNLSQGICNMKYFQDPRQVSSTPHLDKIVRTGQFAYNRATTRNGDKISIAYREGPDCTVSSAYCVFYITDEEVLNPYYLWLWFKRPDFDRYAIFKSHGSAHEFFEFETLCNTYVPMPPIEEQRKIVKNYLAIQKRIENNMQTIAKLEETAQTIYRKMFVDDIDPENLPEGWRIGSIGDIATFVRGKIITAAQMVSGNVPVISAGLNPSGYHNICNVEGCSVTISSSGVNAGYTRINYDNIWAADCSFYNGEHVYFVYAMLMHNKDKVLNLQRGAAQPHVSPGEVHEIEIIVPPVNLISDYCEKVEALHKYISLLQKEIKLLETTNYGTLQ